jgi:hypothetical protein
MSSSPLTLANVRALIDQWSERRGPDTSAAKPSTDFL